MTTKYKQQQRQELYTNGEIALIAIKSTICDLLEEFGSLGIHSRFVLDDNKRAGNDNDRSGCPAGMTNKVAGKGNDNRNSDHNRNRKDLRSGVEG